MRAAVLQNYRPRSGETVDSLFGFGNFNLTKFIQQEGYSGTVLKSDADELNDIFQNCDETELALQAVIAFFNGVSAPNEQNHAIKSILTSCSKMLRNYQKQQERSVDDLSEQLEKVTIRYANHHFTNYFKNPAKSTSFRSFSPQTLCHVVRTFRLDVS